MGTLSSIKGAWIATWSGIRHVFRPRMTLRYPDQKLDLLGPGYHFDPKNGVGGVYLSQILPFADHKSLPLFFDFEKAAYRSLH